MQQFRVWNVQKIEDLIYVHLRTNKIELESQKSNLIEKNKEEQCKEKKSVITICQPCYFGKNLQYQFSFQ